MKRALILLVLLASPALAQVTNPARIDVQEEGVSQGRVGRINCVGAALLCSVTGGVGTFTVSAPTLGSTNAWSAQNEFSGQTNISGPDATTNVEIGSTANDANAGTGGTSIVIGNNASNSANGADIILIGSGAVHSSGATSSVLIGTGVNSSAAGQVLIGGSTSSTNNNAVAIGQGAGTTGNPAIAIGQGASAAGNQIVIGSNTTAAQKDVYFGWGATTVTTASTTPVVLNAPGGSGTDNAGASLTLAPGKGTGAAAGGAAIINRNLVGATGTTVQNQAPAFIACPTKILSNTSATAQTIATITTTTTSGGSVQMFFSTTASNGTLVDADAGIALVSWNNNAGTVAAAMTAIVGQSDSDASGTLATTPTATVATNVVSIKFTPTWVTIVPTLVTGYAQFQVNGVNSVACQ